MKTESAHKTLVLFSVSLAMVIAGEAAAHFIKTAGATPARAALDPRIDDYMVRIARNRALPSATRS